MHNSLLHLLLKNDDFLNTGVSQSSVATRLGCGGVFVYDFVTNFLLSLTVKEFWKSVNIWWSYGQEFGVLFFFDSRCRRPNYCSQGVVYCAKTIWLWVYQYLSVIRLIVSFICKCKSTNLPLATIWRHWRQHFASNIFLCMHGTTLMSLKQLHATKSHDFVLAALDKTAKTVVLAVLTQCFIIL